MSGDRQLHLLRIRRLNSWAALIAVLALLAWGVEYAGHLHVKQDAQVTGQASHFCEICAGLQAGASTVVVAPTIPRLPPEQAPILIAVPEPRQQSIHSYRSRAPPRA